MKNYFIAATLILTCIDASQAQVNLNNPNIDAIMLNQGASRVFRNSKTLSGEILGSQYQQIMFASAKVDNVAQKYFMRYNNYEDEFEFITPKNDTLALDKIDDFNTITFVGTNKKYKLVSYSNNVGKNHKGYLIEMYQKTNYTLYKREWMSFYAGKKAKTSLEKDMPAKFVKQDDSYYLKDANGNIIDFPESKKQLLKLFPDKKQGIETFIKENKIDFDLENDKKRITNLLSTF